VICLIAIGLPQSPNYRLNYIH